MTPAVSVSSLTKKYGEVEAVRGIDFEVAAGETFGLLGPNGAGKSTTIKILCTLADPTSGSARAAGYDVTSERDTVRLGLSPPGDYRGHSRLDGYRHACHSHSRVP